MIVITVHCYSAWCVNPEGELKENLRSPLCVLLVSSCGLQACPCQTPACCQGRGICVGTWLQPCFKGWPWYSKCLIPPAVFCLLVGKRNSVLRGRCWKILFQNRSGGRTIRYKCLSFCFMSSAPSGRGRRKRYRLKLAALSSSSARGR